MCYDEGILQACIDGELNSNQMRKITLHLNQCAACRNKMENLRANDIFVSKNLSIFLSNEPDTDYSIETAPIVNKSNPQPVNKKTWRFKQVMKFKKIIATAAAAAVMFTAFSFPAVRSMAGEFLTIFRMEKVQTISVSTEDLKELEKALQEGASKVDIDNFGSAEVVGKQESVPVTLTEASAAVDFDVKLPQVDGFGNPQLQKITGNTVNLKLEVQKVNSLLQTLGSTSLLPDNLDGQHFSLTMPTAIVATYKSGNARIMITQARSPELKTPANVDALAIRDALLSIPAMPDNLKNQLLAINDWQNTILIPNIDGSSREVTVNGTRGVFVDAGSRQHNSAGMQFLIWQQDGVIYTISGEKLDLHSALEIATQMK
ncbi:anti-sigma factor family protein [Desulfoscipio geothermicus]|uniref:Zinc-finger n=1 Tax=Desulfoscipio geothermicus DSM 3669 TaxID=1121426 RepID=A0A1I6DPA0_9FIRM|nr:zf-HC2 domain-containing protein [Desulfoscipio geothermicus]SFR07255.1 hypothetical protein SAMN05660706_11471 [Desulfoscipio geothermicus DSM 3669]